MNTVLYYLSLGTGIIVLLVGIQNLYTFWGQITFPGLVGQFTGVVCILGGIVNLVVAFKLKKLIERIKKAKAPELVDL